MIVAVIAVWMMQPSIDQEVDVIAVRDRFVPATRAVRVPGRAVSSFGVTVRMRRIDLDHMVVDMAFVGMVKVADVVAVADCSVATSISMNVRVIALVNCVTHGSTIHRICTETNDLHSRPES